MPAMVGYLNHWATAAPSPCWYGVKVWRGENGQAGPSRGGKKFPARIRMRRMEGKFYLSECRILKVKTMIDAIIVDT
ncbi:hypothetical protein TNCV_1614601 [Trichonephila clavipes]|uniref:Uncharacterized protein n=1 Tax=Trichonephila clavipes TaxID=2585209 RepID=A0A8X6RV34_TRICX|nr:hypothetical protein TNCV_1614601 [Trichonephila clavipes]